VKLSVVMAAGIVAASVFGAMLSNDWRKAAVTTVWAMALTVTAWVCPRFRGPIEWVLLVFWITTMVAVGVYAIWGMR
jgi:hypothetical protein